MRRIILLLKKMLKTLWNLISPHGHHSVDESEGQPHESVASTILDFSVLLQQGNINGYPIRQGRRQNEFHVETEQLSDVYLWMCQLPGESSIEKYNNVGTFSFSKQLGNGTRLKITNHVSCMKQYEAIGIAEKEDTRKTLFKIYFDKPHKKRMQ